MRAWDKDTVEGFGAEWSRFDQTKVPSAELRELLEQYFGEFPWDQLPANAVGIDIGCGSGRWARLLAERTSLLVCVDPSPLAMEVSRRNLEESAGIGLIRSAAGELPIKSASVDFAYSLGVIHHSPQPEVALADVVRVLKVGAPLLVYMYYALDNRPRWYRAIWRLSDVGRRVVSRSPVLIRNQVANLLAILVYFPLARTAGVLELLGMRVDRLPLSFYRRRSFYVMRTDALDRFGTRLERRFTRDELVELMRGAGLHDIRVCHGPPYWRAIGRRVEPVEVVDQGRMARWDSQPSE